MKVQRFTLKELLIGTALIAIGLGLVAFEMRGDYRLQYVSYHSPESLIIWLQGGAMVGAGLLYPFNRVRLGVFLAFIVQVILLITSFILQFSPSPSGLF
jgi:hypothetical protein